MTKPRLSLRTLLLLCLVIGSSVLMDMVIKHFTKEDAKRKLKSEASRQLAKLMTKVPHAHISQLVDTDFQKRRGTVDTVFRFRERKFSFEMTYSWRRLSNLWILQKITLKDERRRDIDGIEYSSPKVSEKVLAVLKERTRH